MEFLLVLDLFLGFAHMSAYLVQDYFKGPELQENGGAAVLSELQSVQRCYYCR